MMTGDFSERVIKLSSETEREKMKDFLQRQGLSMDKDLEYSVALMENDRIVAAGSFSGRVLKCIAVDDEYKGTGLSARVISHLVNEQYRRGRIHLFIYTKPENRRTFTELGFYPVAEVPGKVLLMENRPDGIQKYLDELVQQTGVVTPSAAVVVNCNPFTKGHRYLLEYAASRCKLLHVFVVWEDRSVFPAEVRYHIVEEGVRDIPNIVVHKGKDYIISNATFPSYFIKKYEDVVDTHAKLDLTIFSQYIAKKLDIRKRFVGQEPYCPVTSAYNRTMKEMLPAVGIEVEEIPRITFDGNAISASRVRELIRLGEMEKVRDLVPESTWKFLLSAGGEEIVRRIQLT